MLKLSALLVTAALATASQSQDWQIETIAQEGTKPEVRLDSEGQPRVAYMIEDFSGGLFYALREDGPDWSIETVVSGYFYAPLDMVIDDEDRAHIAYHDHSNTGGDIVYIYGSDADWTREFIVSTGHDGWDGRIAVGSDGQVDIISIDPSVGGTGNGIEWATRVDGAWEVKEIGSGSIPYEFGVGLAVGADGGLHVVYHDGEEGLNTDDPGADLIYATLSEGEWEIVPVDTEGDVGKFASIALDSSGHPHIAYLRRTGERTGIVKYAFHDGSEWNFENVDEVGDLEISHFGARRTTTVALDGRDRVYVAYSDRSVLRFARRIDTGWAISEVSGPRREGHALAQFVTMDMAPDGRPHLSFYDIAEDDPRTSTGAVYYALGPEVADAPTAIAAEGERTPDGFELSQNFPNPFNGQTVIPYSLSEAAGVQMAVYDLAGQLVRTLIHESGSAGRHEARWDGRDSAGREAASGVYAIRMRARDLVQTRKMLLLR